LNQDKVKQHTQSPPTSTDFSQGVGAAWPICLGYFPIGLALGVLAQQAGLPWWAMALMSLLVFAGSSQFICVAMLAGGAASPPSS
jgi:predicted branched-subunit amino acid permease